MPEPFRTLNLASPAVETAGLSPPAELLPGQFGRFVSSGPIAAGGMGVVYRARDPVLDREIAVKVLADALLSRPEAVRRFVDEARITGQLQHPGIPPIHEVGELPDGRPFLAMKLIKGRTLADLLTARPTPGSDLPRFVAIFEQVAQAVAYAHDRRVIHRDLKPANIMVGAFGEVQAMDWGLAKVLAPAGSAAADPAGVADTVDDRTRIGGLTGADPLTEPGGPLGTPAYMPPEQAGGEVDRIDRRADVFALGAVLCAILTGHPPYVGRNTNAVWLMALRGQLTGAMARLDECDAHPVLVDLCRRFLAADPADRPADAGLVAAAVAAFRAESEQSRLRQESEKVAGLRKLRLALEADIALYIRFVLELEGCGVDAGLVAIARRLVSNAPADQFATPAELSAALAAFRAGRPATGRAKASSRKPAPPDPPATAPTRRRGKATKAEAAPPVPARTPAPKPGPAKRRS